MIDEFLKTKGLRLKKYEQVYSIEQRPLDFLGFRFGETIKLRVRNFRHLNASIKHVRQSKHITVRQARSIMSLLGWLKQIKIGYVYYKNHIQNVVKKGTLRKIISEYDKKQLQKIHGACA